MTRAKKRPGARGRHLQPVPDPPVRVEVVFDLDPNDLIESIYAGIAHDVGKSRGPLEVECGIAEWLAVTTQMLTSGTPDGEAEDAIAGFFGALIDVARRHGTPQALALLRALSVLPGTPPAEVAAVAAAELATSGVADRAWVAKLSQLRPTICLRYGHVDGSQESLIAGFSYGRTEHAIAVLIDHDLGGGIKDCWVTTEPEKARQQILATLAFDPQVEVGPIDWVTAKRILSTALSRPICAVGDDQVSDTAANIELLRRRVGVLDGEIWQPAGRRTPTPRAGPADQDVLFGDPAQPPVAKTPTTRSPTSTSPTTKTPTTRSPTSKSPTTKTPGPKTSTSRRYSTALQLKATVAGSKPPIWRRLTMPESTTLDRLHELIQIAFGWTDSHLHVFEIDGEEYGPDGDWADTRTENVRLGSLVAVGERFRYVYDFGDNWRHTIEFEKRLPPGSVEGGVRCIGGRRAGPPENCGGIDAYQGLLEVITGSEPADDERLSWAAETLGTTTAQLRRYDPARFDQAAVNAALLDLTDSG